MTLILFQWVALVVILLLLLVDLYRAIRGSVIRRVWAIRVVILIGAGVAIYWPNEVTRLARLAGIERGADLVLYSSVLAFIAATLYLYARCVRLQQQITQIVRHIAIEEAREPQHDEHATG